MIAEVNGVKIFYEMTGEGKPLLLVHGNGEDHTIFNEAAELLAKNHRCIALDSRGHGQSSPVERLTYDEMAADVLALADALGLEHPDFYGFSDGGIVGLLCAIARPGYFDHLICSGANTVPHGVKDSEYVKFAVKNFFKPNPLLQLMLNYPNITREQLGTIRCRTLILAGEHDLIKERHTRRIAAAIPGCRLKILPGEGHGSYVVHSTKIADIIESFCGK